MTPALLAKVGESLYGARWRSPLARDLGISERTIFYWLKGTIANKQLDERLAHLLTDRAHTINALAGIVFDQKDRHP